MKSRRLPRAAALLLGADLDGEAARPSEDGFSTCGGVVAIIRGCRDAGEEERMKRGV